MSVSCTVTGSTALSHVHLSPLCILRSPGPADGVVFQELPFTVQGRELKNPTIPMSKTLFLCDGNNLFKPISKMGWILETNLSSAGKNIQLY